MFLAQTADEVGHAASLFERKMSAEHSLISAVRSELRQVELRDQSKTSRRAVIAHPASDKVARSVALATYPQAPLWSAAARRRFLSFAIGCDRRQEKKGERKKEKKRRRAAALQRSKPASVRARTVTMF